MTKIKDVIIHLLGFTVLSFGIACTLTSRLGAAPLDAFNYFLAKNINDLASKEIITVGITTTVVASLMLLFVIIIEKKLFNLISLVFLLILGLLIDFFLGSVLANIPLNTQIWFRIILALVGLIACSLGAALTLVTLLPASPFEMLLLLINRKIKKLALSKFILEGIIFILAIILGILAKELFDQINFFSVVYVVLIGPLINFFHIKLKKQRSETVDELK